jgi:hypothetical protein
MVPMVLGTRSVGRPADGVDRPLQQQQQQQQQQQGTAGGMTREDNSSRLNTDHCQTLPFR